MAKRPLTQEEVITPKSDYSLQIQSVLKIAMFCNMCYDLIHLKVFGHNDHLQIWRKQR